MAEIKLTIPDEKLTRVKEAFKGIYPIPLNEEGEPAFTDNQWGKEVLKRFVIETVQRWEQKKAMDLAKNGVALDTGIVE